MRQPWMLQKIFLLIVIFSLHTQAVIALQDKPSSVNDQAAEKIAERLFVAFKASSWEEVIKLYIQLPEPYRSLEEYRGIVILSNMYLNKIPEAERLLNELLQSKPDSKLEDLPEYFRQFKEKASDNFNRYYVAALFSKIVKKDLSQALKFLGQIKHPSMETKIEIADIYARQKKYVEALRILSALWEQPASSLEEKAVRVRILPQIGKLSIQLGDYIAAVKYFREYFAQEPENMDQRLPYANVLMEIRRFDLAINQFELYAAHMPLNPADKVAYMRSLVNVGNFEKASSLASGWIDRGEMPLLSQIELARLLFVVQNYKLVDKVLMYAVAQGKKSSEENRALIQLYMDLGNFKDAAALISLLKRDLEASVPGLLLLADFYTRISDPRTGYDYALRANQIDSLDPKVAEVLQVYEQNPSTIARNLKSLEAILQNDEDNTQLWVRYVKGLILLGIEAYSSGQVKSLVLSSDLQKAKTFLEDLLRKNPGIPELYFLRGKIAYLMDDNEEALNAFRGAIQFCPSYVEASQYLALIEKDRHHLDDALAALKAAVKFEPWNAKAWLQLGELFVVADRSLDGIQAFEMAKKYAPYSPEPIVELARLYLQLNRIADAVELLKTALELDPKEISAVKLMLKALYNKNYERAVKDLEELKKMRLLYFDKLEALDPKEADALRRQFSSI